MVKIISAKQTTTFYNNNNNNNNNSNKLEIGCHPVAVFILHIHKYEKKSNYEGWNCNSGNYLFTTDTK